MRFLLIILLSLLLLVGSAASCRKKKLPAANEQPGREISPQSSPQNANINDFNTAAKFLSEISEQKLNKPALADQNTAIKPQIKTESTAPQDVNKPADSNRPADPNVKVEKPVSEPNKNADQKPSQEALTDFQKRYAALLSENVTSAGLVNYRILKQKRAGFYNLLEEIKRFDTNEYKSMSKEEKVAFWINVYNIKMLSIIIDNYPIESTAIERVTLLWPPDSIRYISRKIGDFEKQKLIVMNEEFTLERIEQDIFYKQLNWPEAFFALTHSSLSGPPFRSEPYGGKKLNEQLDDQIKKFLSSTKNFNIDTANNKINLPAILQGSWYGRLFVSKYDTDKRFKDQLPEVRAALNLIIKYLPANSVSFLETKNYKVSYIEYDWRINDQQ